MFLSGCCGSTTVVHYSRGRTNTLELRVETKLQGGAFRRARALVRVLVLECWSVGVCSSARVFIVLDCSRARVRVLDWYAPLRCVASGDDPRAYPRVVY